MLITVDDIVISFEVPGRPSAAHRPRFTRKGRPYKDPAYRAWFKKVREYAHQAAYQADWEIPPRSQQLYLLVQYFFCTWRMGFIKSGQRQGQYRKLSQPTPDSGNCHKPIEDACQKILYHNDNVVDTIHWPDCRTFITKVDHPDKQKAVIGLAFVDGGNLL